MSADVELDQGAVESTLEEKTDQQDGANPSEVGNGDTKRPASNGGLMDIEVLEDVIPDPDPDPANPNPNGIDGEGKQEETEIDEKPKSANMGRRAAVDTNLDINLALMKRVKKISIEIPFASENQRRLQKVILGVRSFQHIVDETIGGKYGVPSRPDLETQVINFSNSPSHGSEAPKQRSFSILYSGDRQAFIMSAKKEDELVVALHEVRPNVGVVAEAYIKAGEKVLNVLDRYKIRSWRRFVHIYMRPLVEDEAYVNGAKKRLIQFEGLDDEAAFKLEKHEYSDEESDESGSSDNETKKKPIKKSKKRHNNHRHHHSKK